MSQRRQWRQIKNELFRELVGPVAVGSGAFGSALVCQPLHDSARY